MNVIKTGMVLAVAALAALAWREYGPEGGVEALAGQASGKVVASASDGGGSSSQGFVDMPLPDGQSGSGVVIFAPVDCPSDAAQRADALAQYLSAQGVPYVRSQNANFGSLNSQEEANRVMAVMEGGIPVVFVRSRAKANPSPEAVVAEYRAGKS
jgi:hypothetical protein